MEEKPKKTIKIPWEEFVSEAVLKLCEKYKLIGNPVFMVDRGGYEGPHECYDTPTYVEIEIS